MYEAMLIYTIHKKWTLYRAASLTRQNQDDFSIGRKEATMRQRSLFSKTLLCCWPTSSVVTPVGDDGGG